MSDGSYVKALRSEAAEFLDRYPVANHMLNVIARRAKRLPCIRTGLDIGECFLSHKSLGITEQQYRTAKKNLESWGFVKFRRGRRATEEGTVAKLLNSDVYDINKDVPNGRTTEEIPTEASDIPVQIPLTHLTEGKEGNNNLESDTYSDGCGLGNGRTTEDERKNNGRLTINKELKKERKDQKISLSIRKIDEEEILAVWNEMDLKQHRKITDRCMKHIKAGYTKYGSECKKRGKVPKGITVWVCVYLVQGFSNYITDHHRGVNDRGWIANLEYALRPSTYDEVTSIKD
ncbi:hypothetical protein [Photobacterium profundum]|uniref:Uncharacterized protein n=1 Tax=Photobacterium profundum (strain SS9) TaxID=298386 RepID=Q6LHP6_PHOPR|nr:hypothetical protein [Photobacterium profundum]CAG23184.1 hypothetical protein PBPRB1313 [Photobacterium profundum SS9]